MWWCKKSWTSCVSGCAGVSRRGPALWRQCVGQRSDPQQSFLPQQQTKGQAGREGSVVIPHEHVIRAFCHLNICHDQLLKRDAVSTVATRVRMLLEELLAPEEESSRDRRQTGNNTSRVFSSSRVLLYSEIFMVQQQSILQYLSLERKSCNLALEKGHL